MDEIAFALRFGFLVGRFRESLWYFECAIMLRKFLVVAAVTFLISNDGKAAGAVFVLVASLCQLMYLRLYQSQIHTLVVSGTTCILYAGTLREYKPRRFGIRVGLLVSTW